MMLHFIIKAKLHNVDFVRDRTEGFEKFIKEIERQDVDQLAKIAGVDKEMVKQAAIAYATAKNSMEFHGLGVTEHEQGSKTVMLKELLTWDVNHIKELATSMLQKKKIKNITAKNTELLILLNLA
jgi:predicted molibdopterin-dependent oxidoreductase YjgC